MVLVKAKFKESIVLMLLLLIMSGGSLFSQTQSPGLDVIGFGYDVFGKYADQSSKKPYCLFKYDNFSTIPVGTGSYSVPRYVLLENISQHNIRISSGESVREYSRTLSQKAGIGVDAAFFSASVSSGFSKSSSGSERKYFYTYMDANTKWRISLDMRQLDALKSILDPQFKKDLYNMNPDTLFKTYGTHFLASAYLGGRANFSTVSTVTEKTTVRDIELAIEAKYKMVSSNYQMNSSESNTYKNSQTKETLTVTGGNSEYANNIKNWDAYKMWASGIESKPVLCDFVFDERTKENISLKPIWLLCDDSERAARLEMAFEELCKKHPLPSYVGDPGDPMLVLSKLPANLTLHVKGGKVDKAGSTMMLYDLNVGQFQQFYFVETERSGEYKLRTKGGLYLMPANGKDRADIVINTDKKQKELIWIKESAGSGYFRLKNKKTGYYLTVEGNSSTKGSRVMQNTKKEIDGQKWKALPRDSVMGQVKNMYDEKWSKGWTTVKAMAVKGARFIFHYKKGKGTARNASILPSQGKYTLKNIYDKSWSEGWTSLEYFNYKDRSYHLSIKSGTGDVHVDEYQYDGKPKNIYKDKWSKGWTNIEIIYVGSQPYFLHYKNSSGLVRIGKLSPKPAGNVWEGQWEKNISAIRYFKMGKKDYIFILSREGKAWTFEIKKSGDSLTVEFKWVESGLEGNISNALVMDYRSGPMVLLYKSQTGAYWYRPIYSDGTVGKPIKKGSWSPGWTDFDTWKDAQGNVYFLHHKESGETKINRYSW